METVAIRLLLLLAGLAVDAGTLRDGDFEYTEPERQACSDHLWRIRNMGDDNSRASAGYHAEFRSCVRSLRRKHEQVAAQMAEMEKRRLREEEARNATEKRAADYQIIVSVAEEAAEDPKFAQPILSALLCNYLTDRASLLSQIAKDQKYSKIGGAVNLRRRAELQDDLAETDDGIKALRASLRAIKRPALACTTPKVAAAASCLSGDPDDHVEWCSTPEGRVLIETGRILTP